MHGGKNDMCRQRVDEVKDFKIYCQEFHHKCVNWYITVLGLYIAGAIASGNIAKNDPTIGWVLIGSSFLLASIFFYIIGTFDRRIKRAGDYLANPSTIPEKWYEACTAPGWSCGGVGTPFFLTLMFVLLATVFFVTQVNFALIFPW